MRGSQTTTPHAVSDEQYCRCLSALRSTTLPASTKCSENSPKQLTRVSLNRQNLMLGNESKEQTMLCRMCPIVRRQCDANTTPARACFAYLFAQITRRLHWFDHQGLYLVSVLLFLPLFAFSFSIYLIIFTLRTSKDAGE